MKTENASHKITILNFTTESGAFYQALNLTYQVFGPEFLEGLENLKVKQLYAIIGGSVGGGIAWEMAGLNPKITKHLIPVASDWKATDWLIANCFLQEQILKNSSKPIEDARIHAMLCYRSPESFKEKFQRTKVQNSDIFNIESWLNHHGDKLQKRFQLSSYKLMNQLLIEFEQLEQILKDIF